MTFSAPGSVDRHRDHNRRGESDGDQKAAEQEQEQVTESQYPTREAHQREEKQHVVRQETRTCSRRLATTRPHHEAPLEPLFPRPQAV